jgi:hypothetical protein
MTGSEACVVEVEVVAVVGVEVSSLGQEGPTLPVW